MLAVQGWLYSNAAFSLVYSIRMLFFWQPNVITMATAATQGIATPNIPDEFNRFMAAKIMFDAILRYEKLSIL